MLSLVWPPIQRTIDVFSRYAAYGNPRVAVFMYGFVERLLTGALGFACEESAGASFLRRDGNVWTSSADAVRVYTQDGTLIGRIKIPEIVSNLCFGGPKRNRLYITAQTSLYAIYVNNHPPGW